MLRRSISSRLSPVHVLFVVAIAILASDPLAIMAGDRGADEPKTEASIYGQGVRETQWKSPADELAGFHLPKGYVAELVASEPAIAKPLNMAFDKQGRLWVTDTVEYPYPVPQGQPARDSIKVLSDRDFDGKYETVQTFADGLNIPIGILPVEQGVICFSIPNLMLLRDTDGDGRCDDKRVLLGPFDTTRDTHGMINAIRRGNDGWIYACHGFNNQSHVKAADGSEIHLISGNTFRFREDGSHVEQFTTGQVNPFGMTSDEWGNWFTADCHSKPVTMLVHGGYYESFGRPHDGLGFVPAVMDHLHGSTAICGITKYLAEDFSAGFRGKFYSGNVMTSRINCNRLAEDRDRIRLVEEPDFMTSDDPWFRPVDILLGTDGALYVADFYNKIIGHYEVRLDHPERDRTSGRIWRIRYLGEAKTASDTGLANSPAAIAKATASQALLSAEHLQELSHPNATRRHFALERLLTSKPDAEGVSLLKRLSGDRAARPMLRQAAVWALHAHGLDSESILAAAVADGEPLVVNAVLKAWSDTAELQLASVAGSSQSSSSGNANTGVASKASHDLLLDVARQHLSSQVPQLAMSAVEALSVYGQATDVARIVDQIVQRESASAIVPHTMKIAVKRLLKQDAIAQQILKEDALAEFDKPAAFATLVSILPAVDTTRATRTLLQVALQEFDGQGRLAGLQVPAIQPVNVLKLACKQMQPEFNRPVFELFNKVRGKEASTAADARSGALPESTRLAIEAIEALRSGNHPVPNEFLAMLRVSLRELLEPVEQTLKDADTIKPLVWQEVRNRPWPMQDRKHQGDGKTTYAFRSSFPLGESYTGKYISSAFACPETLSFWLAGHDGEPKNPAGNNNYVQLVLVDSGEVIAKAAPPRNDAARQIEWKLSDWVGKSVRVECIDGDDGNAYAWLAVEGFSYPPLNPLGIESAVVQMGRLLEVLGKDASAADMQWIEELIDNENLNGLPRARLIASLASVRGRAVARQLIDLAIGRNLEAFIKKELVSGSNERWLESANELASSLTAQMTLSQQTQLVKGMIATADGRRLCLELVDQGRLANESLRTVQDFLTPQESDADITRLLTLSKAASAKPSESEQAIIGRIATFKLAGADAAKGKLIYEKNCMNCHKLRGVGQLIGPQLDGVGPRGPERLAEDILLPGRNVDKAFRMTSIVTEDDRVIVGLARDNGGDTLEIVGTDGKIQTLRKSEIAIRKETTRSLMPDNFAELINNEDLSHLLQYIMGRNWRQRAGSDRFANNVDHHEPAC